MELEVQKREKTEKPAALRARGVMPAVFYGPKEDATPVSIDTKKFAHVWGEAGGSSIVTLKGVGDDKEALIQDVAVHPVTGTPEHADLYVIERGKKIEVTVPVEFIGEAPAEKAGHIIVKALHEVEISVRPSELPQHFEVDISGLHEVSDSITVSSISLPESGEFITDPDETLVIVKEAREEPEEPTELPDFAAQEAAEEAAKAAGESEEEDAGNDES